MNSLTLTLILTGFAPPAAADPPAVPEAIDLSAPAAEGPKASSEVPPAALDDVSSPTVEASAGPHATPPEGGDAAAAEASLADVGLDDASLGVDSTLAQPLEVSGNPAAAARAERPVPTSYVEAPPPTAAPTKARRGSGVTAKRTRRQKSAPRDLAWRLDAQVSAGINTIFHRSYQMFDRWDRKLTMTRVAAFGDYRVGRRLYLGGGAAYRSGQTESSGFLNEARTSLQIHDPSILGRIAWVPAEGIDLYGVIGAGPSIIDTTFNAPSASLGDASQRNVTFVGDATLGAMLYLPQKWLPRGGKSHVTAGLDLNLGYALRGAVAISPEPTLDDEPLATTTANFGQLRASGLAWNLGIFVRFQ